MVDGGSEFCFLKDVHEKINVRIDISILVRPMTTKFGKQVRLTGPDSNEANQVDVGDIIMSR